MQFAYPATNSVTKTPLYVITDIPYQLKRHRRQSNDNEVDFINKKVFQDLAATYPNILPHRVLDSSYQSQSVPIVLRKYLLCVEEKLHDSGHTNEEEYVHVVREWFEAYDKQGLKLSDRLDALDNFDTFLLGLVENAFGCQTAKATHFSGLSRELLEEGLTANIVFHCVVDMLPEEKQREFNSRCLSTDGLECLFSMLVQICEKPNVRIVLQSWRTICREKRKQMNEQQGYPRHVRAHTAYNHHEISLKTFNLPEDDTSLSAAAQHALEKRPCYNIIKQGKKRNIYEVDRYWVSIRRKVHNKRTKYSADHQLQNNIPL